VELGPPAGEVCLILSFPTCYPHSRYSSRFSVFDITTPPPSFPRCVIQSIFIFTPPPPTKLVLSEPSSFPGHPERWTFLNVTPICPCSFSPWDYVNQVVSIFLFLLSCPPPTPRILVAPDNPSVLLGTFFRNRTSFYFFGFCISFLALF